MWGLHFLSSFESSIFVMDGGVSGECLDYGGKSKWSGGKATRILGKAAAAAWSERGGGDRKSGSAPPSNAILTRLPFFICNWRRFLERSRGDYVLPKCPQILISYLVSNLSQPQVPSAADHDALCLHPLHPRLSGPSPPVSPSSSSSSSSPPSPSSSPFPLPRPPSVIYERDLK